MTTPITSTPTPSVPATPPKLKLCKRCHLLKPEDTFRMSDGRLYGLCYPCRVKEGKLTHVRGRSKEGTTIGRIAYHERPRKLNGLARLHLYKPVSDAPNRPLFASLPEHLRPMAYEHLQWMLRRHPDATTGSQKYKALLGCVAWIVKRKWMFPDRNWGRMMLRDRRYLSEKRIKQGIKVRYPKAPPTPEQVEERAKQKAERAARAFTPSQYALDMLNSIPYTGPDKNKPFRAPEGPFVHPVERGPRELWKTNE